MSLIHLKHPERTPSMDIDSDFQKFKEECEKDDSEIRECENQRKLVKQNKMCLIKFDSQLDEI